MPTAKYQLPTWALCFAMFVPSVFAAPVTDLPTAPTSTTEKAPPISGDALPSTTFTRSEAARALNLGQLEAIQAETVLFEAQLARAKALNELNKNGYDRSVDQPFNPAPPSQDNTKHEVKGAAQEAIPPQVIEISGDSKGFSALLALSNGNQVSVQTGSRIPGTDFVVKRITLNEVVVSMSNQSLISLSFSG
ncbi:type IV pilus biogenesis protein PilP [Yersinia enterocolitica]|uniref:type IV pilus biogenesis protein PilP n=1 Tax=Yersinia enterocolitica TaxID=630 RepID=UPI003D7B6CB4